MAIVPYVVGQAMKTRANRVQCPTIWTGSHTSLHTKASHALKDAQDALYRPSKGQNYSSTGLYFGTRDFMMTQAIRYARPQKQNMMK